MSDTRTIPVSKIGRPSRVRRGEDVCNPYRWPRPRISRLQLILKISERCNLACPYCYYYFAGDESANGRTPLLKLNELTQILDFLVQGVSDLQIGEVNIVFHGGEPMLMKARRFDEVCSQIYSRLSRITKVSLGIQTNGTLISEEWLAALQRHSVAVGISIDGPANIHDRMRYDWKKRGSHELISKGIALMKARGATQGGQSKPGTISVMSHTAPIDQVYWHLSHQLEIDSMSFLLPDRSHDKPFSEPEESPLVYGMQLATLFDCWLEDSRSPAVREIEQVLSTFQVKKIVEGSYSYEGMSGIQQAETADVDNQILVIQSDGTVSVDDSLIPALTWRAAIKSPHVTQTSLLEYLQSDFYDDIFSAYSHLPEKCSECKWKKVCRGGALENRFRSDNGFQNPSVYCEGLFHFFEHVEMRLIEGGYPKELFDEQLGA